MAPRAKVVAGGVAAALALGAVAVLTRPRAAYDPNAGHGETRRRAQGADSGTQHEDECSSLQGSMVAQCVNDCDACRGAMSTYATVTGACALPVSAGSPPVYFPEEAVGQSASAYMQATCAGAPPPPPPPPPPPRSGSRERASDLLTSALVGCFSELAWIDHYDDLLVPPASGYYLGSSSGVSEPGRTSFTVSAADPFVHQCMRGCDDLGYNHFGIYNQQECICGNGAPTTTNRADQHGDVLCLPCEDSDEYECGDAHRTSVYRDFNRVWKEPQYRIYEPPPPPALNTNDKYKLTEAEMLQLFAKLDNDKTGTIAVSELVDVFDLVDNGALTVPDCQGNQYPHRWVGDGFCDDGTETEDGKPDFNCNAFQCDQDDCTTGCVAVDDRDRVTIAVDADTSGNYGNIAALGEVWWAKFEAKRGETYWFIARQGSGDNDLVVDNSGDSPTWLTVELKEKDSDTPIATYEINSPDDVNSADGTANSWVNTGVDRTIYMEVRVKKSDGVCHMDLAVRTPPKPRPFTFSC